VGEKGILKRKDFAENLFSQTWENANFLTKL